LDRCIYWSMRFASRSGADVLCICIDTMDKAKFSWPRFGYGRLSKKLEGIARPRTVFTAALAHGYGTYLYMASEEQNHGSDAFCEVLCFTRLAARGRLLGGAGSLRRWPFSLKLMVQSPVHTATPVHVKTQVSDAPACLRQVRAGVQRFPEAPRHSKRQHSVAG